MYIIEVIPLTLLPSNVPQLLSYFFNEKLEKGAIVEISFGNRKIRAAIVASNPLEDQKISLKKSGFQLKKISGVISEVPLISNKQFKVALWLSRHYYAPLGYCLKTVLPAFFFKKGYDIQLSKRGAPSKVPLVNIKESFVKPVLLLSEAKETLANITPFIQKSVKELHQVALILPDASTIQYFYENLSLNYSVVKIHSGLNNKKLYESWQKIESGQADIILGTRQALFMPFKNLGLIIVDDILHEFYKSEMTPRYNTPDLAETIADLHGAKTIFISPIIGVENYYHIKNKDYDLINKTRVREPLKMVNMVGEIKSGNFSIFSQEFKDQLLSLTTSPKQNNKILIFSPRRGYSGILICQDCGYAVKCKDCGSAFRIHKTTNLVLMCHHCSRSIKMPENCPNCNSFKLKPVGPAGTQKIYDEIQRVLMMNNLKVPVLILDTDVVKNETEEDEIINEIKSLRTSILISTQMVFSHRYSLNFDLIAILNADSLVNTPDFKIEERLFYQIEKLLDFNPKNIFIQTYNPENPAILTASKGNYKDFYGKELETRKIFYYPPYSQLIKLIFRHKYRDKALCEAKILSSKIKMAIIQMKLSQKIKMIDPFPSFTEKERGLFVYNIVLKILPELEDIREILKFVPSNWSVDVDPRSII